MQKFKFYWVNEEGNATSVLAKKGTLSDNVLTLDGVELPVGAISEVDTRDDYLILAVARQDGQFGTIVIKTGQAARLKQGLGRSRSAVWAAARRQELSETGEAHVFREQECPACQAVIDLTGLEASPQVYCQFCHTVSTLPEAFGTMTQAGPEKGHRLCDECGMFSRPRRFTIFYFYWVLVVYGWNYRTTHRCTACMRKDAWKMLLCNLPFVIGVPVALVQLFRSYGGTNIGAKYAGLDAANIRARKGDIVGAIAAYQKILEKHPTAVGVKYNLGLAFLQQTRIDDAARMFEFALRDCSNYPNAASRLITCYESLGEKDKLRDLKRVWRMDAAQDQRTEKETGTE